MGWADPFTSSRRGLNSVFARQLCTYVNLDLQLFFFFGHFYLSTNRHDTLQIIYMSHLFIKHTKPLTWCNVINFNFFFGKKLAMITRL